MSEVAERVHRLGDRDAGCSRTRTPTTSAAPNARRPSSSKSTTQDAGGGCAKEIELRGEPADQGFGIVTTMVLPGGVEVLLYQSKHASPFDAEPGMTLVERVR